MKFPLLSILLVGFLICLICTAEVDAQKRRLAPTVKGRAAFAQKHREIGGTAIVIDETLSVLRIKPSLFAESVQRMRRGRKVQILGATDADGVKFYRVSAPPNNTGWVQADALFGKFRTGDEERLARLVQASDGFDQIELAVNFLEIYPDSQFRPSILLLFGDLLEETCAKLSKDANSRLSRREMAASAAPLHSYYLNFVSIDRYRKLGILFLFNSPSRTFHYDGASWKEIVKKYPASAEAAEAQKRLDTLKLKMEKTAAK
ncbi:MAG: SH3 domain-containing protein [Acidobacteriota bacterium]|nr:SH3 domain-containing protein [Acidobacteriota bacterium]